MRVPIPSTTSEAWRVNGGAEVASQAVISHLRQAHRHQFQSYILPYRMQGFPKRERGDFTFSVIRDPLAAARAAYLEVSRRSAGRRSEIRSDDATSYRSLSCADGPKSVVRYLRFLQDVERGQDLGPPRSMCSSGAAVWCHCWHDAHSAYRGACPSPLGSALVSGCMPCAHLQLSAPPSTRGLYSSGSSALLYL